MNAEGDCAIPSIAQTTSTTQQLATALSDVIFENLKVLEKKRMTCKTYEKRSVGNGTFLYINIQMATGKTRRLEGSKDNSALFRLTGSIQDWDLGAQEFHMQTQACVLFKLLFQSFMCPAHSGGVRGCNDCVKDRTNEEHSEFCKQADQMSHSFVFFFEEHKRKCRRFRPRPVGRLHRCQNVLVLCAHNIPHCSRFMSEASKGDARLYAQQQGISDRTLRYLPCHWNLLRRRPCSNGSTPQSACSGKGPANPKIARMSTVLAASSSIW